MGSGCPLRACPARKPVAEDAPRSRAFTEAVPRSPATRHRSPSDDLAAQAAQDAALAAEAAAQAVADAAEPDGIPEIAVGSPLETIVNGEMRRSPQVGD